MNLNLRWARNIANNHPVPPGGFLRVLSQAILAADDNNLSILDQAITELRIKYQKYDIPEHDDRLK